MKTKTLCAINLVLLLLGTVWASSAAAQDDGSQGSWKAHTAARQYPDDEQPVRTTALTDDAPPLNPPLPLNIDSPSNAPARRAKATGAASDAGTSVGPQEAIPAPHGARNYSAGVSRGDMTTKAGPPGDSEYERRPGMAEGEVFDDEANCGDDDFGACMPNMRAAMHGRLWVRGDALLWWLKGAQTPPLITSSPASTPLSQAGVLGQPDTTVLFGGQELNAGLHAGGRISFGTWLGNCEESGVEMNYFIIGQNQQQFTASGADTPVLARPFFDTSIGAESSQVIAYPNAWVGSGSVVSTESLQGAEVLWRQAIVHPGGDGRVDMLMGYRFARLIDGLLISDTTTSSGTAAISPGTEFELADSFHTRNDFNGADLGFSTQWRRGRLALETLLKVGIGETHSEVDINGSTAITTSAGRSVYSGGILALPSNSGLHPSDQFSLLPEIGVTASYDLTCHLTASVGYTLLYWSDVARPGDQIDPNVDSAQFPPPIGTGTKPAFTLHTSDFWAQGVNLGLNYRF